MADDKKNIPEVDLPGETVTPPAETPAPKPALTDQEAVTLEHEGLAALFEMGEAVPDPGEQPIPIEPEKTVLPEQTKAEKEQPTPGKDDPAPEHSSKVVDFAAARNEAEKTPKEKTGKQKAADKDKTEKPGRGRPPKEDKDKQRSKPRDKKGPLTKSIISPAAIRKDTKKDAFRRQDPYFIIRLRFKAVAERRQWSSAASNPRRKTRVKLWLCF